MLKSSRFVAIAAVLLSVLGLWLIWNHLTDECLSEASITADTILSRMRTRSIDHSLQEDNDETKSLIRLLDKTRELNYREKDVKVLPESALADYVKDQRLTGAVILNSRLEPVLYEAGDGLFPWQTVVQRVFVKNILTYPFKQFAAREAFDDIGFYDYGVVARQNSAGLVMTWEKKKPGQFGVVSKDLYPGDTFAMDSLVFVVRNGRIVSTNLEGWNGQLQQNCPFLSAPGRRLAAYELNLYDVQGEKWYGRFTQVKGHQVFVLIPETPLFEFRKTQFGIVLFGFVLVLGLLALVRIRTGQSYMQKLQTQFDTIQGISSIYVSTYLVRIPENSLQLLKSTTEIRRIYRPGMRATDFFRTYLNTVIAPSCIAEALAFFNIETLAERLASTCKLETKLQLKDGRWIRVMAIAQTRNKSGTLTACLLTTRDITEEQQHEAAVQKQLREAAEAAKSAAVAKMQFLRHMSHDVRTPINGIRGLLEVARRAPNDMQRQTYCREKIWMISGTLLELVNDVLDMSKLDSGGERLESVPFDISELMDELVVTTQPIADKQGVLIKRRMEGSWWRVIGSRKHLRRICINLVFNAVKFTPAGGSVTIGCRAISAGSGLMTLEFSCRDTGRGMSKEFQKHIFEPFMQEDSAAARTTYQGTGLGLVITKQLVRLMGGSIDFVSEQGRGTTFTVRIPLKTDDSVPVETSDEPDIHLKDLKGMRVLLVEDNEINREIAHCFLTDAGVEVTEATNGAEAVKKFEEAAPGTFDLVLMDIMMPSVDGLEATRRIRALPRSDAAAIPIIAMTANVFDDDIEECFQAGMNQHLSKPLDYEKLFRVLSVYRAEKHD